MKTRTCQSGSDMPPGILWKLHHGNRAYNFNTTVNDPMDSCKNTPRPTQSLQDGCACCVCCACVPTAMRPGSSPSGTSTPATIAFSASQRFSTNRGRLPCMQSPQRAGKPSAQGATSMQVTGLASSRWTHRNTCSGPPHAAAARPRKSD